MTKSNEGTETELEAPLEDSSSNESELILMVTEPPAFVDLTLDTYKFEDDYGVDEGAIFVSRVQYDQEMRSFNELVKKVLEAEKMMRQHPNTTESNEKFKQLMAVVVKLRERLKLHADYLDELRIKEEVKPGLPCWPHLYAGLNQHRDNNSDVTLAEFYSQKINIVDGLKMLYDPITTRPKAEEFADQPPGLRVPLMKHQKHALKWLTWREKQKISGGILADDMGLGKTLTMISLVLHCKNAQDSDAAALTAKAKARLFQKFKQKDMEKKFNLFANSDDEQQKTEAKHAKLVKSDTKPFINKECKSEESDDEQEALKFRKCHKRPQFFPSDSDDDEASEIKHIKTEPEAEMKGGIAGQSTASVNLATARQRNSAGTLVICPASVMYQWSNEVATKVVNRTMSSHVYHGSSRREMGLSSFKNYDIIITSYNIVTTEHATLGNNSWLFDVEWQRIILDEAHIIRNIKTGCCQSICQLRSNLRWALTGTPIQNRAKDAFALMQFLKVPQFNDLQKWNQYLKEGLTADRRLSFVLNPLMLRRTKALLQESGEMPPLPLLKVKQIDIQLSEAEMAVYQILASFSANLFAQFLYQREQRNEDLNYGSENKPRFLAQLQNEKYRILHKKFLRAIGYDPHDKISGIVILVLLLRLRQFCCHPGLMVNMLNGILSDVDLKNIREDASSLQAELKIDVLSELDKFEEEGQSNDNASSEATLNATGDLTSTLKLLQRSNPIFNFNMPSSKMRQMLDTLDNILLETDDKVIVVSQWTSYLDIMKQHIEKRHNSAILEFTGKLSVPQRLSVLQEFNDSSNDKRVLLLSLTAGGVGLNLNVANHMLLIDLHWNPQLERQAQDRIYRFGQKKPTFIYRFMCVETVEQRIKALQNHKLEIANVVLNQGTWSSSNGGLSVDELKKLFAI